MASGPVFPHSVNKPGRGRSLQGFAGFSKETRVCCFDKDIRLVITLDHCRNRHVYRAGDLFACPVSCLSAMYAEPVPHDLRHLIIKVIMLPKGCAEIIIIFRFADRNTGLLSILVEN